MPDGASFNQNCSQTRPWEHSLQQSLAALGAGTGQGGRDGYGLFQ